MLGHSEKLIFMFSRKTSAEVLPGLIQRTQHTTRLRAVMIVSAFCEDM